VDNDICTLDGKNTLHAIVIIASGTPASSTTRIHIPRINATTDKIKDAYKICFVHQKLDDTVLSRI
jgi:hypothetical protein